MSTLNINPNTGAAGTRVTATGTGYGKNQNLRLYSGSTILAAVVCDEHGSFVISFPIPATATGEFIVRTAAATATAAKFTVAVPPPPPPPPTGARLIDWVGTKVYGYTDAQLAECAALGIGGFVISIFWLDGVDPLKQIPDDFAARCRAHGIDKLYFAITPGWYNRPITPFGEWFDTFDTAAAVLTKIAAGLKARGFDGIAFDNEGYKGVTGGNFTWDWNYPGRTHTEAEVRAQVRTVGGQVCAALVKGFDGIDIVSYHDYFDASFMAVVQNVVNHAPLDAFSTKTVVADFWDGMAKTPGRGPITFFDATFYFCPVLTGWTNDAAMGKNKTDLTAMFAARGWADTFVTPFLWMGPTNGDGSPWTQNNSMQPAQALAAAQAARRNCGNGMVANYDYEGSPLRYLGSPFVPFTSTNGHIVAGDFRPAYRAVSS